MEDNQSTLTSFDAMTFSNRIQILKTLFPYMPPASQKLLSSYIKASELSTALRMCEISGEANLSACSDPKKKSPLELLNEIKGYCSKNEQSNIDMALNFFSAFQMYQTFMEAEKEAASADLSSAEAASTEGSKKSSITDLFKNMLSPEQQSVFDNYRLLFNTTE